MEKLRTSLGELAEAFLLSRRVSGCTEHTLSIYHLWLGRFMQDVGDCTQVDPVATHRFVAEWQERGLKPATVHRGVRALRAFFRWCVAARAFSDDPLRGLTIRLPKTLPQVPTEDELRAVLAACPDTLEGIRNRALILTLADSALRASEALHLLVEDWRPIDRGLFVRAGKGKKDRTVFIGPATTRALKAWLARHPMPAPESFLFVARDGSSLKRRNLIQILHRLSYRRGCRRIADCIRTNSGTLPGPVGCGRASDWMRFGGSWAMNRFQRRCNTRPLWPLTFSKLTGEPVLSSG